MPRSANQGTGWCISSFFGLENLTVTQVTGIPYYVALIFSTLGLEGGIPIIVYCKTYAG